MTPRLLASKLKLSAFISINELCLENSLPTFLTKYTTSISFTSRLISMIYQATKLLQVKEAK